MTNIRYRLLEGGLGFGIDLSRARRKISRTLHTSLTEETDAVEEFNRGAKRGDTILVTGDRPRLALMRTFPEDKSDPDLIKLGDLRMGIGFADAFEWIDQYAEIKTVFQPSRTEYTIEAPAGRNLRIYLTLSQAGDWGAVSKLTLMNVGDTPSKLALKLVYGGIARHGRTFTAAYFDIDKDNTEGNEIALQGESAILKDAGFPERICAWCVPPAMPGIEDRKAVFRHGIALEPGESRTVFLLAGRLDTRSAEEREIRGKEPEELIREASEYYDNLLAGISISTPSRVLDSAFLTGIVNLEYVYAGTLWLEGVHWWSSFWCDNFQISAAISLGQLERARKALDFLGRLESGPCPALMASGKVFSSHIGVYSYGIEEGLPYYLYQLLQYAKHSGDMALMGSLWNKIRSSIVLLFEKRANSGSGLLDWHLGCNGFLYQADHLAMPGDAASPSIMIEWLLEGLSGLARELGEEGDAQDWERASGKMREKLLGSMWNGEAGVFYNHVDYQGIKHMSHYYTDMVFPVLYSDFPDEKKRRSMDALRRKLVFEAEDGRLLMLAGDLKPSIFGNDNVMPVQMCESARALFRTGDRETGFRLLESVALAATIYTEAPGNFPERMDDDGKGEANYIFGNPAGSYLYSVISGLFGLSLADGGKTIACAPAFPSGWDRADLRLPYCAVSFRKSADGGHEKSVYTIQSHPARKLEFEVLSGSKDIRRIQCAGGKAEGRTFIEDGMTKVAFVSSEAAERFEIIVECSPSAVAAFRRFARLSREMPLPSSRVALDAFGDGELEAFDIGQYLNSDTIRATSAWRNEELPIDLSGYGVAGGEAEIEGLRFRVESGKAPARPSARMILLENSWSDGPTGRTIPSGRASTVRIAVGERIKGLALLYASECQSRQTGVEVGDLRFNYTSGSSERLPLKVGRNLDSLFSHFAEDTLPVGISSTMQDHPGHPGRDYINLLVLACDPGRVLDSVEFSIDLPDVQMGIIALNLARAAGKDRP